jgi:hypothetical protein
MFLFGTSPLFEGRPPHLPSFDVLLLVYVGAGQWGGHDEDRKAFKKAVKKDKALGNRFGEERTALIKSGIANRGKGRFARASSVQKQALKTHSGPSLRLIAPRDKYFPLDLYTTKFGNPKSKANRAKGHRVVTIAGKTGVAMPSTEDSDVPWDLERVYEQGQGIETTLAEHDGDQSEDFDNELGTMQADLQAGDDAAYAAVVQGQSFEAMMREIADAKDPMIVKSDRVAWGSLGPRQLGMLPARAHAPPHPASCRFAGAYACKCTALSMRV